MVPIEVISCLYVVPVALSQLWQVPESGLKSSTSVSYTLEPEAPISTAAPSGHLSTGAKSESRTRPENKRHTQLCKSKHASFTEVPAQRS